MIKSIWIFNIYFLLFLFDLYYFLIFAGGKCHGDPEFVSAVQNITVPVGRDVKFSCHVRHLGNYKVPTTSSSSSSLFEETMINNSPATRCHQRRGVWRCVQSASSYHNFWLLLLTKSNYKGPFCYFKCRYKLHFWKMS